MKTVLLVLLGGALGTGLRYFCGLAISYSVREPRFPWAHLIVNVSGCFAIGVLAELFEARLQVSSAVRAGLLTGVLGGYTTFSSFGLETYSLLREGHIGLATLNVTASVFLGLAAVWLGIRAAHLL